MKILFVSAILPYPLHSGGQIRIYHLLKQLALHHKISLFAFIRDPEERTLVRHLSFCRKVELVLRGRAWQPRYLISALGKYPFLLSTYNSHQMRLRLQKELETEKYDLIHLEPFYVWPALPRTHFPLVVAEHNIEYRVYSDYVRRSPWIPLRPLMYADVLKLRFWEEYIWRKTNHLTVVSPEDRAVITSRTTVPVTVVANGVDLATFRYQANRPQHPGPQLLFVGNFAWLPNQEAARTLATKIWPRVLANYPKAQLRIIGRNMTERFRRLARKAGASTIEDIPDIASQYAQADMLIAPIAISGGSKFKILEAMASGLPVVTTREGVAGLPVQADVHYLMANIPREFVTQVSKIWENKNQRLSLASAARRLVAENYSWEKIAQDLEKVWTEVYERNRH